MATGNGTTQHPREPPQEPAITKDQVINRTPRPERDKQAVAAALMAMQARRRQQSATTFQIGGRVVLGGHVFKVHKITKKDLVLRRVAK